MTLVIGTAGDDVVLYGTFGDDTILGLEGDDRIDPRRGTDVVDGGEGFDTLALSRYSWTVIVVEGSVGTASAHHGDTVTFTNIEAIIATNDEANSVHYSDVIDLRAADRGYTVDAGAGMDLVYVSPFADTITLGAEQGDFVHGGVFDYDGDVFLDWDNSDSMGFDNVTFDASNVIRTSTATVTTLEIDGDQDGVTDATVTLLGDYRNGAFEYVNRDGNTFLYWNSNSGETLTGFKGDNVFRGSLGDDTYYGLGGNDILEGDAGNDTLFGGDGNDRFNPGTGNNDFVDGGLGIDTLDLSHYDGINLAIFGAEGRAGDHTYSNNVTFSNIERIIGTDTEASGSSFGDYFLLRFASQGYYIEAGAGLDVVVVSPYRDRISLGADQGDIVSGFLADYNFDIFNDFDNSDSMQFRDVVFDASDVTQLYVPPLDATILFIDGDHDGATDATILFFGDYTDGAFEYVNINGNTFLYWSSNTGETLSGGEGTNIFRGSLGDDTYFGLGGGDLLSGNAGNDTLNGGGGDDFLYGHSGADTLIGGPGADRLTGGADPDTLTGGAGTDTFIAELPNEFDGDTITDLEIGEVLLFQNADFDRGAITLTPGETEATLSGDVDGDGTDDFVLTLQGDFSNRGFIVAHSGADTTLTLANVVNAGNGRSSIAGTDESEIIDTGNGPATATGAGGDDLLLGGSGPQTLSGGDGNDQLFGGKGSDTLDGADGLDRLAGGHGNDTLTGGQNLDIFIFEERGGHDTITDFEDGLDLMDLSAFGFTDISELSISQNGADTEIGLLGGVSITLENFDATNLDNSDFLFG